MDESEDNMSSEDIKFEIGTSGVKKPKKRSLVERELETNLTARVTSPITNLDSTSTSRYGRARRLLNETEPGEKLKSPKVDQSLVQSPVYKMYASNSPVRVETPKRLEQSIDNQIETIYNENISLSRFGSEEKTKSAQKHPKVYVRKDLIQSREKDNDTVILIKNMFSPNSAKKSEEYNIKSLNGYLNTSSVVKTLDFDGKKKKEKKILSKNELFDIEAKCEYQVGDLAWARMGTYPFWPCIITRDPMTGMYLKKKLFGRVERDVLHVTFFGDNGRRGWIVDSMLRKFLGQLEFEATKTNFTPEAKKKDPRLYAAYFVSDKRIPQWQISVDEAETLLREPKRLRIDILNDMLEKNRTIKTTPKHEKSKKVTRTDSDVSLSESLYDTLFSEDDSKVKDLERSRSKSKNRSLDVSEVVTACLDNMAAKTGITKIQRQSHMDRWLQKAKSKTPEKSQLKSHIKVDKNDKLKKKFRKEKKKSYSCRSSSQESLESENKIKSNQNEHDYSQNYCDRNSPIILDDVEIVYENAEIFTTDINESGSGLGIISKVETLCGKDQINKEEDGVVLTVVNDEIFVSKANVDNDMCLELSNLNNVELVNNVESINIEHIVELENKKIMYNESKKEILEVCDQINSYSLSTADNEPKRKVLDVDDQISEDSLSTADNENHEQFLISDIIDGSVCRKDHIVCKAYTDDQISEDSLSTADNENHEEFLISDIIDRSVCREDQDISKAYKEDKAIEDQIENNDLNVHNNLDIAHKNNESMSGTDDVDKKVEIDVNIATDNINYRQDIIEIKNNHEVIYNETNMSENLLCSSVNEADFTNSQTESYKVGDLEQINIYEVNRERKDDEKCELDKNENKEIYFQKDLLKNNMSELILKQLIPNIELVNEGDSTQTTFNAETTVVGKSLHKETDVSEILMKKNSQPEIDLTYNEDDKKNVTNIDSENFDDNLVENSNGCTKKNINVTGANMLQSISIESNELLKNCFFELGPIESHVKKKEKNDESIVNFNSEINKSPNIINKFNLNLKKYAEKVNKYEINNESSTYLNGQLVENDLNTVNGYCKDKIFAGTEVKRSNLCNVPEIDNHSENVDYIKQLMNENHDNVSQMNKNNFNKIQEQVPIEDKILNEEKNVEEIGDLFNTRLDKEPIVVLDSTKKDSPMVLTNGFHEENDILINKVCKKVPNISAVNVSIILNGVYDRNLDVDATCVGDDEEVYCENQLNQSSNRLKTKQSKNNDKVTNEDESCDMKNKFREPEFLKYLELRKDTLIDEQLEVTEEEITNYLYKTWLYEESLKTETEKADELDNANLIKGLNQDCFKIKKVKKKNKIEKENDEILDLNAENLSKEKPKRRIRRPNYKVDYTYMDFNSPKIRLTKIDSQKEIMNETNQVYKVNEHVIETDNTKNNESVSENLRKKYLNIVNLCNGNKDTDDISKNNHDLVNLCNGEIDSDIISKNDPQPEKNCNDNIHSDIISEMDPEKNNLCNYNIHSVNILTDDNDEPLSAYQLRCKSYQSNQNTAIMSKLGKSEMLIEIDPDNISIKSEDSEVSTGRKKRKEKFDKKQDLKDPEFLKYLELRQDTIIDENPELTLEEITDYLYKTWLYEESLKTDTKKADDIDNANLVKGLNQDQVQTKKIRKKTTVNKEKESESNLIKDKILKEKSKRKIIQPYYKEHFSDIEDDIEYFEIFKPKQNKSKPVECPDVTIENAQNQIGTELPIEYGEEYAEEEFDEVEEYFRQLTAVKPNLFKGLIRERVCEICEKVGTLVKCKGCHDMFHVDCVKKEIKVVEITTPSRGRKKKKNRGRKPKEDSGSQSDEKSHDPNFYEEMQNNSMENDQESNIVANADDFENKIAAKMKELLENPAKVDYDSGSNDENDWSDINFGECKIVDINQRQKELDYSNFKCKNCQKLDVPICFVCKLSISPKDKAEHRQKCLVAHCHKYFHMECLDHWPQTQFNAGELTKGSKRGEYFEAFSCPRHVCHTCVCDDPRGCKTRFSGDKLARCVRCPATYHTFTKCLPAGTQILTGSHIICPRHYEHRPGKVPCHVNTGWCFICALGGTLICCEYCPTSFHAECLNLTTPPEGGYMCEDCETGRLPLYGEMVWVKLGHYRWWPGIILHPSEIPLNILAVKHSLGEFVVRFFGQYDYYWVNRGRVFPFQEGDSGKISTQKSKIDAAFMMAIEHAQRACEVLKNAQPNKEESIDIAQSLLPPHYVKLKVNKPIGSLLGRKVDIEESSLTQCECDPFDVDPCGPYTQCLNRMLLTECGPTCRAGDRCNNRAFEKRLYPKLTPYRTPHRGWGLRTLEEVKAGQFVIEYVGELIDEEEFQRRMRRKHEVRDENFYFLTLDKERVIDAGPKGNLARFMNHSCEPNCETQKWTVLGDSRVGLFAIYDIPANSELTFNYNLESAGIEKKACMCGAKRCSGYIGAKPKQDEAKKTKRAYKKRKPENSPSTSQKPKNRGRPTKPRELTEIEKDLLIIKNATNAISSDSECSRLSIDSTKDRSLKRKKACGDESLPKRIKMESEIKMAEIKMAN